MGGGVSVIREGICLQEKVVKGERKKWELFFL